jgi:hypothetical protein
VALTAFTTQSDRGRCRSLHCEAAAYGRGIALSFGHSHGRGETGSAQAHRRLVAQMSTCSSEVVRSNIVQATFRASGLHNAPDDLRTESAVPNGNRPHVAALSDHVGDDPMVYALQEAFDRQPCYFCPSKTTPQQNRNYSVVTFATQTRQLWPVFGCEFGLETSWKPVKINNSIRSQPHCTVLRNRELVTGMYLRTLRANRELRSLSEFLGVKW